jgi:hypothetical protein
VLFGVTSVLNALLRYTTAFYNHWLLVASWCSTFSVDSGLKHCE